MTGLPDRRRVAKGLLEVIPRMMHGLRGELWRGAPPLEAAMFRTMAGLGRRPCSLSDLAGRQGVSLPTMSRTISSLVERGWVERREDPGDRRQVRLELTPVGRAHFARAQARLLRKLADGLNRLSAEEMRGLAGAIAALERAFPLAAQPDWRRPGSAGRGEAGAVGREPARAEGR
jgi:DNA-binding MarR family transcriptional regulator